MNPQGEPIFSRALAVFNTSKDQRDLERKVLAAAFKLSFQKGDTEGAALVHKGLCAILQQQLYDGDDSSNGAVIPSSVWDGPQRSETAIRKLPEFAAEPKVDAPAEPVLSDPEDSGVRKHYASGRPKPVKNVAALSHEQLYETVHTTGDQPALTDAELDQCVVSTSAANVAVLLADELQPVKGMGVGTTISEVSGKSSQPAAAAPSAASPPAAPSTSAASSKPAASAKQAASAKPPASSKAAVPPPPASPAVSEASKATEAASLSGASAAGQAITDATPVLADHELSDALLDPAEVEEAFAVLDAPEVTESQTEPAPATADAPANPPQAASAEAGAASRGEISAALERLTAAMPVDSGTTHKAAPADRAAETEDSPPSQSASPMSQYGKDEVISLPVMEAQFFEAPPPRLELSGQDAPNAVAPGPMGYLDFDGPHRQVPPAPDYGGADEEQILISPELIAEMFQQAESQQGLSPLNAPPPMMLTPSQLIRTQSFYQILGVNKLSSYEDIHKKFLRLAHRMLRTRFAEQTPARNVREFREVLKHICVAHDILRDPVTRTDYDLRQLGMRKDEGHLETPADAPEGSMPRTRLMIGELLEIANILDRTELQIALDMHKAEPGTMFGSFLVKAGFLNPEELDSALLGQRLISSGKITVAQYQAAMFRMRDHSISFFDTLMVEGWLTPSDMLTESADLWPAKVAVPPPADGASPTDQSSESAEEPAGNGSPAAETDNGGSNGHGKQDHAAVVAAAMHAESELLKSLEGAEENVD